MLVKVKVRPSLRFIEETGTDVLLQTLTGKEVCLLSASYAT